MLHSQRTATLLTGTVQLLGNCAVPRFNTLTVNVTSLSRGGCGQTIVQPHFSHTESKLVKSNLLDTKQGG